MLIGNVFFFFCLEMRMSSLNNRPSYLDNEFPLQAIETEKTFSIMLIPSQEFASLTILRPCGFCLFLNFLELHNGVGLEFV
jgi:hypothetical protein